jgi:Na+(H+)/acetate symporter ActP
VPLIISQVINELIDRDVMKPKNSKERLRSAAIVVVGIFIVTTLLAALTTTVIARLKPQGNM